MAKSRWFVDPLYARMRDDLHLTGKSENTRKAYLRQVRKLCDFAQSSPERITEDQLRAYFLHLKNDLHFAYGSRRFCSCRRRRGLSSSSVRHAFA